MVVRCVVVTVGAASVVVALVLPVVVSIVVVVGTDVALDAIGVGSVLEDGTVVSGKMEILVQVNLRTGILRAQNLLNSNLASFYINMIIC